MREELGKSRESMSNTKVLEEPKGVLKSGFVTAAFSPVKTKKQYFAVLGERSLELHDNEKHWKKRKQAKHLFDLSVSFNVSNDHYDPKLKKCVCLMGPDETLVLKGETDLSTNEWYDAILSSLIPARALRLGRPVLPFEFFEYCWDVEIVLNPKLKKPVKTDENLPNMCTKTEGLVGLKRLCFYAHTIVLCKRKIEPAQYDVPSSGIPPFRVCDFLELQRKFVATFGCQEKYFLMRMGRSSPMGACELWACCENEEVANDIHDKLNRIIDREAEKKKKMGNGPLLPPNLMLRAHAHGHRERSHTQPIRPRTASIAQPRVGSPASFSGTINRKSSTGTTIGPLFATPFNTTPPNTLTTPSGAHSARVGSISTLPFSIMAPPKQQSIFPSQRRKSSSIKEEPRISNNIYQSMGLGGCMNWTEKRLSPSTSAAEETEDSGGTLRLDNNSTREADSVSCNSRRSLAVDINIVERRRGSKDISSSEESDEMCSIGGAGSSSAGPGSTSTQEEYAPMDAAEWSLSDSAGHLYVPHREMQYQLEEVRSYVSDSSDSCYSSIAATNGGETLGTNIPLTQGPAGNPPRAYSFGARTTKPAIGTRGTGETDSGNCLLDSRENGPSTKLQSGLMPPAEDPRKRAFSLGSKSFFQRPLRKLSAHVSARQARHSQTSASGASLTSSSNASSLGPLSSSSANHISALGSEDPYGRNRSGSFGSGRPTPYNRRGGLISAQGNDKLAAASRDHLVEIDFGGLGRSGSGSMASVDSPSRSRTSSFGCKSEFTGLTILGDDADRPKPPSQILLEQAALQIQEAGLIPTSVCVEGDYVMTNAVDVAALKAQAAAAEEVGGSCYGMLGSSLSPPDPKLLDIRQSQHFETIQENASGKSSRCSSRSSNNINEADEDDYTLMEVTAESVPINIKYPDQMLEDNGLQNPSEPPTSEYSDYNDMRVGEIDTIEETPELDELKPCESDAPSVINLIEKLTVTEHAKAPVCIVNNDYLRFPSVIPAIVKRNSVPSLRSLHTDSINYTVLEATPSQRRNHSMNPTKSGRIRSKSGVAIRSVAYPQSVAVDDDYSMMKH